MKAERPGIRRGETPETRSETGISPPVVARRLRGVFLFREGCLLNIEKVSIEEINPAPYNPRLDLQPGDPEYEHLKKSIDHFDLVEPLVWNRRTGNLISGHQRLKILKERGDTEIEVSVVELSKKDEKGLNLALNKIRGDWDFDKLADLLTELDESGFNLDLTGFDTADIEDILTWSADGEDVDEECDPDLTLPEEPDIQPGQLITLGEHRLLCGDSTEGEDVEHLLGGDIAAMVWTDPPYGVEYVGKTADELTLQNDNIKGEAFKAFLERAFSIALQQTRPGGVWYVAAPAGPNFLPFAQVLTDLQIWRQTITWVKDAFVMGHSDFHYRHEVLFYGWKPGASHRMPPSRALDTVWEIPRPRQSLEHPTMKPVPLIRRGITYSSPVRSIVLDMFGGSGSTLIACEQSNRRARLLEIDPRYCDVIVRRWEQFTGLRAEVVS